jgi:aryl-alcohol dehydrogenase-like predicted oxidoreductase
MDKINKIVIGTWGLSGDYGNVKLKTIQDVLEYSYSKGIKEYDTAPSYGNGFAEFCLGNVFIDKDDVLINTKIGNIPFTGKCFDIEAVKESFNQSLKRLKRDYIHILFLHNPRGINNYKELLLWIDLLKKEGKIKLSGICLARDWDYSSEVDLKRFDVIQDDANLLDRNFEKKNYFSKIFYGRSPLASGILSGSLTVSATFPKEDHRSGWLKGERLKEVLAQIRELNIKDSLPAAAREFVLNHPRIDKVIFGVKNMKHIKDLVEY